MLTRSVISVIIVLTYATWESLSPSPSHCYHRRIKCDAPRRCPMRMLLSLALLSLLGTAAFAQGPVPKGEAPRIGLASAVDKDGKVIIKVFELRDVMRMKVGKGGDVFV